MNTDKDEAMVHQPYHAWMHELLDGALAVQARAQLETHLAGCLDCQARWASLSAVDRLFKAAPMAAPRAGFAGRFKARQAQRRSRPRLVWGAVALGVGAVGMSGVVAVFGLALIASLVRVAQQPATLLALNTSVGATAGFVTTVVDALIIAGRALLEGALDQPLAWAGAVLALALTGMWLIVMRRLAPQGGVR
jgi:anti-sigma factor RsiW